MKCFKFVADSWSQKIFYTHSPYELKDLLIKSDEIARICIFTEGQTTDRKMLYACTFDLASIIHDDIVSEMKKLLLVNGTVKEAADNEFFIPYNKYKDDEEFIDKFTDAYLWDIGGYYFSSPYGWLVSEFDLPRGTQQFIYDVMDGDYILDEQEPEEHYI